MNLAAVLNVIKWVIMAVAFVFGIIGAIGLIRRAVRFWKCAKEYIDFVNEPKHESVYGKVIYRKAINRTVFVRNLYEITAVYRIQEKEYRLTELSVGQVYSVDDCVKIEYVADYPEEARLRNGTDSSEYESCVGRTIADIVFIAAVLFFCPIAISGIFVWVDYIIRFVYELAGGVPYNL